MISNKFEGQAVSLKFKIFYKDLDILLLMKNLMVVNVLEFTYLENTTLNILVLYYCYNICLINA